MFQLKSYLLGTMVLYRTQSSKISRWTPTMTITIAILAITFTVLILSSGEKEVDPLVLEQTLQALHRNASTQAAAVKALSNSSRVSAVHIMVIFYNAEKMTDLRTKFRTSMTSMFKFLSKPVIIHIIGDTSSATIARNILAEVANSLLHEVKHEDIDAQLTILKDFTTHMEQNFGKQYGAFYFFISTISHLLFPSLDKVIMLDIDLKFNADLMDLYAHFEKFSDTNIMGMGPELQPIYREAFRQYRKLFPNARIAGPPKDSHTGYNSGVLLMRLERMRKSNLYNDLLTTKIKHLRDKYQFKGHLGDQCFFTLISAEYSELFYTLPCTWNRQLCEYWKMHGDFREYFDQYQECEGHINIYHGNCNTKMPKLDWE